LVIFAMDEAFNILTSRLWLTIHYR